MPTGIFKRTPEMYSSRRGKKWSTETRKKMLKRVHPFIGKHHTNETKEKIRKSLTGRKLPEEWKKKLSIAKLGEKSYQWKKDRSTLVPKRRATLGIVRWVRAIKNRDKNICRMSNPDCSGRLEVHHILPWRSHPELRFDIKNGITLCHHHHPYKRSEEERLVETFKRLIDQVL